VGRLTGGILLGTGVVVLADVAVASVVSVLFLGWTLIIGGAIGIGVSLFLIRRGGFWIGMLGGVLALVAGLVLIRNPETTLLALSLAIGAVMLVNGVFRLVAAVQHRRRAAPWCSPGWSACCSGCSSSPSGRPPRCGLIGTPARRATDGGRGGAQSSSAAAGPRLIRS
jgi:uncharacterized membrane protein HdeD (DUF308 family)